MGAKDPLGLVNCDHMSMVMVGKITVGDHKALLHTKYIRHKIKKKYVCSGYQLCLIFAPPPPFLRIFRGFPRDFPVPQ